MKKLMALLLCFSLVFCFTSCKTEKENENATGENVSGSSSETTTADNSVNIFEEMKNAASNGDYAKALELYKSGAADVATSEVLDWYYFSLAMSENKEYGCIGYPLNLMQYNVGESFALAKNAVDELKSVCSVLNGAYECEGRYMYIADGKVAINFGSHLTGSVFCSAEIAEKDGSFYYSDRKSDGAHILSYTVEKTEDGKIFLSATDENTADFYSGEYVPVQVTEFPELIY